MKYLFTKSIRSVKGINFLWLVSLVFVLLIIIIPLIVLFKFSISDNSSLFPPIPLWPHHPDFSQYKELLGSRSFIMAAFYSLEIALLTVLLSLITGAPVAYVLSRLKVPGISIIIFFILAIRFFPGICSVVPVVEFFSNPVFNLLPVVIKVVLAHTLLSLPYVIFMCQGVFDAIPVELEEQALILKAGRFYTFIHIVVPIARTGIAAAAIYVFLLSWNEFVFSYFLMFQSTTVTLPVFLFKKIVWTPQLNYLAAISVCLSVPVILFTFIIQKQIVMGATEGSSK